MTKTELPHRLPRLAALTAVFLLGSLAPGASGGGQDPDARRPGPRSGTLAKRIDDGNVQYPADALRQNLEGWVLLSFVVGTDGRTKDVIVDDSSGDRSFVSEALKSVARMDFEPGTMKGEPVEQCHNQIRMMFSLHTRDDRRGASRGFARRYKKILRLLDEDLEAAKLEIEHLAARSRTNLYESSRVSLLRSLIDQREGDREGQLANLYRAFADDGKFIEKNLHARILVTRLGLEVKPQRFGAAKGTLAWLEALDGPRVEIPDWILTTLEQVRTTHAEGRAFAVPATIGEADESDGGVGIWGYTLYGRTPGIERIDGELDRIDVRCTRNRMQTRVRQGKAWRIPEDWGGCWIYVSGKPGTTFRLVEHAAR